MCDCTFHPNNAGWCSATALRATNLLFVPLAIYAVQQCLVAARAGRSNGGTGTTGNSRTSAWAEAAVITTVPLLFFFNFLYYTDPGSTCFVRLCRSYVGSRFGLRYDGRERVLRNTARTHLHQKLSGCATSLDWLLISSCCDVISGDRVHGYTLRLVADFLML
jgi:hypothetical protein